MALCIIFIRFGSDQKLNMNKLESISIVGAGVAGLTCACELLKRGHQVAVYERGSELGEQSCSWYAGGMLAPWCERESAEPEVVTLGVLAKGWWQQFTEVQCNGSLVLSTQRDQNELRRFARLTENHQWLDGQQISSLESDLESGFQQGLFFEDEAHINPRQALSDLADFVIEQGGVIHFNEPVEVDQLGAEMVVDCRGFAAQSALPELRGVKGEMLILKSDDISLWRPVRLLHPRYPLYIVPRKGGEFMVGATMIENQERNRITVLSMLELLSSAYALNNRFGEAEVVEVGVDVRPAFNDNLPRLHRKGNVIYVNGLFRHGFLLGPAMAMQVADALSSVQHFEEIRQCA